MGKGSPRRATAKALLICKEARQYYRLNEKFKDHRGQG